MSDGTVWDLHTGVKLASFFEVALSMSRDGHRVFVERRDSDEAKLFDVDTGATLRSFQCPRTPFGRDMLSVAVLSPDGRRMATHCHPGPVNLWDLRTQPCKQTERCQDRPVSLAEHVGLTGTFSPDGRQVMFSGPGGTTSDALTYRVFSTETGQVLSSFDCHNDCASILTFSPDGHRVLMGRSDGKVDLRDPKNGTKLFTLDGHKENISSLAFSPDGAHIVTGSDDGTAKMWDARTGAELATLAAFTDGTWAVVDQSGRFDGSGAGDVAGLHWVVRNTAIALSQLKERYYEPGLLAKVMGFNKDALRPVERLGLLAPALFPSVEVVPMTPGATELTVHLKDQGGGIGKVRVLLNGKEVPDSALSSKPDPKTPNATVNVKLAGSLKPGEMNQVKVIASDAGNILSNRGIELTFTGQAKGARIRRSYMRSSSAPGTTPLLR